jgi:hypothetical protein
LTRQIAPHSQRRLIESVGSITGPIRIQYIRIRRPLSDEQNHEIARDLNQVSDPYWLVAAANRWKATKEWLTPHLAAGATPMRWPTVIKKLNGRLASADTDRAQWVPSDDPSAVCNYFTGNPRASDACNRCGSTWWAHVEHTGARLQGGDDSGRISLPLASEVDGVQSIRGEDDSLLW